MSTSGRNPAQKPSRVTRVPAAGKARSRSRGPVSGKGALAAERGHAPGPVAPGPTTSTGAPIPGRGPESPPTRTSGSAIIRDMAPKGNGTTIASRANAAGRRRGVAG